MRTIYTDPVCGMSVHPMSDLRLIHDDAEYLFCNPGCLAKFKANPERYLAADHQPSASAMQEEIPARSWKSYLPLIVLVSLTLAVASAKQVSYGNWTGMAWMHDFMGLFLVVFSMFKFFDLRGFADGFQLYDLLAKPLRPYAFLYPFLELGLGLAYLAHWQPQFTYITTAVLMTFGSLGVLRSLVRGQKIQCACMGTILKVPLSTVALVEDLGMAVMAMVMLGAK